MMPNLMPFVDNAASLHAEPKFSPLVLADRLISLACEADSAGLHDSACRLLGLMYAVLDDEGLPI